MYKKNEHLGKRLERLVTSTDATDLVHEAARKYFITKDEKRAAERNKPTKDYPYISDSERECDRQVVYSLMNVPETDPADLQGKMNMETGLRVEQMVGDFLEAGGYHPTGQNRIEIPVGNTVVVGRPDYLLASDDGHDLVEVKKVKVYAINDDVLRNGPSLFERGVRQGNLYIHGARQGLLGEVLQKAERCLLVWVLTESVKGEPGLFAWWRPYKDTLAEFDLNRLAGLKKLADAGTLPAPPPPQRIGKRWNYTFGSWPCGWCGWRAKCYSDIPADQRGKGEAVVGT